MGSEAEHLIPTRYSCLHSYLYGKNADSCIFMLKVLIKILHEIFEQVNLIFSYAVYWMFVIYFSLLPGSFETNNSQNQTCLENTVLQVALWDMIR